MYFLTTNKVETLFTWVFILSLYFYQNVKRVVIIHTIHYFWLNIWSFYFWIRLNMLISTKTNFIDFSTCEANTQALTPLTGLDRLMWNISPLYHLMRVQALQRVADISFRYWRKSLLARIKGRVLTGHQTKHKARREVRCLV